MEAKELMIGDFVRIGENDKYSGCIGRILSLQFHKKDDGAYFDVFVNGEKGCCSTEVFNEDIEPIPLTPEILEKNGFSPETYDDHILVLNEKSGEVIYYGCGQVYGLTIDNQYSQIRELKIQYLHELQHALRLCGIDKEIEL